MGEAMAVITLQYFKVDKSNAVRKEIPDNL